MLKDSDRHFLIGAQELDLKTRYWLPDSHGLWQQNGKGDS